MRDRPILFSDAMVRAILDGRKAQTRRVVKPQPIPDMNARGWFPWCWYDGKRPPRAAVAGCRDAASFSHWMAEECPYGQPGDRLWVRETHAVELDGRVVYQADRAARHFDLMKPPTPTSDVFWLGSDYEPARWRPSIHMPRWASRITLEVTDVRVERLQEINGGDALAEGIEEATKDGRLWKCGWEGLPWMDWHAAPVPAFRALWDQINGAHGYGWDVNPWVWVVEFRRID